jgi:hypothetical protein
MAAFVRGPQGPATSGRGAGRAAGIEQAPARAGRAAGIERAPTRAGRAADIEQAPAPLFRASSPRARVAAWT